MGKQSECRYFFETGNITFWGARVGWSSVKAPSSEGMGTMAETYCTCMVLPRGAGVWAFG